VTSDPFEHVVRDRYVGAITWDGPRFTLRCAPAFAARSAVWALGSWGLVLALPTAMMLAEDGLDQRGAWVGLALMGVGLVILFMTAWRFLGRTRIDGDASELVCSIGPLVPRLARRAEVANVDRIAVEEREPTALDRLLARRDPPPASGFVVRLHMQDGTSVTVPAQLTRDHADRLRSDLVEAIERAKLLRAEAAGFRG